MVDAVGFELWVQIIIFASAGSGVHGTVYPPSTMLLALGLGLGLRLGLFSEVQSCTVRPGVTWFGFDGVGCGVRTTAQLNQAVSTSNRGACWCALNPNPNPDNKLKNGLSTCWYAKYPQLALRWQC